MEELVKRFAEWYKEFGYPVLFFGVMLENAGIPVPGETAVFVAGFLASEQGNRFVAEEHGAHRFTLAWVILVTFLAATLGDNIGYWLGRRFARPRLQVSRRFLFLTPRALERMEDYFHRFGTWTIFFARFITGVRVFGAMAAGTAGMRWGRFFWANAAGAVTWATVISLVGYYAGEYLPTVAKWLGRSGMIILAGIIAVAALLYFWRRWKADSKAVSEK